MKIALAMFLGLAALPTWAGGSSDCYKDCFQRGYEESQCVMLCADKPSRGSGTGLLDQPGAPHNPYLDALPDPIQKRRLPPPPAMNTNTHIDPRCMDDCSARGHQYGYCRKQCGY